MLCPDLPLALKHLFPQLQGMWLVASSLLLALFGIASAEESRPTQGYVPFPG